MIEHDSRKLLIYLAVKYDGDPFKISAAVQLHEGYDVPIEEVNKVCASVKSKVITLIDFDYPSKLKYMYRPPFVLFYYGDISLLDDEKHAFAVVGSREYSEYGESATRKIVKDMARGNVLVSGMARGIDTIAHEEAIANHGRTVAVLGSGIDNCYPLENKELYEELKKNHLVISEYPGMSEPASNHFPMRNRIVVALSNALVVPQINSHMSGTIISVNIALSQNKPIFVVPHSIFAETVNNELLLEGATMAQSGKQILEDLKWNK